MWASGSDCGSKQRSAETFAIGSGQCKGPSKNPGNGVCALLGSRSIYPLGSRPTCLDHLSGDGNAPFRRPRQRQRCPERLRFCGSCCRTLSSISRTLGVLLLLVLLLFRRPTSVLGLASPPAASRDLQAAGGDSSAKPARLSTGQFSLSGRHRVWRI